MATRQTVDGVGVTTSQTWYPSPGIELGRAGGAVASLTRISGGTGYSAASGVATTTDGGGSGLTVTTTVASGVINAVITIANGGDGYRIGDQITVSGGGGNATFTVASLSYTN